MIEIFIVLIVAGGVWYLWKDYQITRNDKNIEYQVTDHSNNKGNIRESLSCLKGIDNNGYKYFPIVGTSYRKLVSKDIGYFEGKAVAEKNNKYDRFAVAIYNGRGKHVGYIPRDNYMIHQYISRIGGYVEAVGFIDSNDGSCFWGDVYIKFDKNKYVC